MGKLDKLIQQYCPDGVEYVKLGDVCIGHYGKGNTIPKDGGDYPVYGCKGIVGATSSYNGENLPLVGHIGSAGSVVWGNGKFFATYNATICSPIVDNVLSKYLFYFLQNAELEKYVKGSQPFLSFSDFSSISIPLPPLPLQEEIVRILDTFSELQTELEAELQARQEQYKYYQDILLNKSQYNTHIPIGDLCCIKKGNTPIQKAIPGDYPLVVTSVERRSCNKYQFDADAVCIPLISSRGHGVASLNHVYYQEGKFALGNILCAVIPNNENILLAKYMYYYLEYAKDFTLVPLMKGGANVSMHCSDIEKVKIPIPSLEKQRNIVSILDRFDSLVNDLSQGLPAEIEARRQQYEYYRDKLLTFNIKNS